MGTLRVDIELHSIVYSITHCFTVETCHSFNVWGFSLAFFWVIRRHSAPWNPPIQRRWNKMACPCSSLIPMSEPMPMQLGLWIHCGQFLLITPFIYYYIKLFYWYKYIIIWFIYKYQYYIYIYLFILYIS